MTDPTSLPPAENPELRLGYLRLSDSVPVIAAYELGLYERFGLQVQLQREVSWANVRDKLVMGDLQAAQMLAPLPLSTTLGLGGLRAPIVTGLTLSLNGNAITVSSSLDALLREHGSDPVNSAASSALALRRYLDARGGGAELTFAAAHSFSCHSFQLRRWMRAGGVDPDRDVRIIVLPPQQMVDSLARGVIDGFCVGEPWNTVAVQLGIGAVQATGYQIWNNAPEKVLGVTEAWHERHPATHLRLRLALMEASRWLAAQSNREAVVEMLQAPQYLDLPEIRLRPSLTGEFVFRKGEAPVSMPDFHVFSRYLAGFPWRSGADRLMKHMGSQLGREFSREQVGSLIQQCFRTDLYREAARWLNEPAPDSDYKQDDCHDDVWSLAPGIELGPDRLLAAAL
ncbi:MAG: CmpA/NrtA family ABC transporter substrate-binding protein [Pseudomonadota bacterium]